MLITGVCTAADGRGNRLEVIRAKARPAASKLLRGGAKQRVAVACVGVS
jgi:hypothetical protein